MDIKIKSVKFNFIMNAILTMSSFIFPLITFPYISRVLLVEGTGKVSFATSVVSYFSMFSMLGISSYGVRSCARVRNNKEELTKMVHELFIINSISTLIVYIIFIASLFVVDKFKDNSLLLVICSISMILNVVGVNWFYSAIEQYSYITIRSMIFKVISIVLMFLFVKNTNDYVVYAGITVFSGAGSNILNFIYLRNFISLKPLKSYNLKRHIKPMLTFFGISVATSIYTNLDNVMLGFMTDDTQVGLYSTSIKIKSILVSVITSLGAVLMPRLSYYIQNNMMEDFNKMIGKTFNFVSLLAIPLALYCGIFSKEIILLIAGEEFLGAVLPMRFLMLTIVCIGYSYITAVQMLVPLGMETKSVISYSICAVIDFVLNLLLIKRFGASAAAFSTMITELCVVIIQSIFLREYLYGILKKISILKLLISIIPATIVSIILKYTLHLGVFVVLVITCIAFFGIYAILLLIQKEPLVIEVFDTLTNKLSKFLKLKT